MVNQLISDRAPQPLEYSKKLGAFRYADTKRIVSRDRVLFELDQEVARTQTRLKGIARLLASDKIDLPTFQIRFAEELKLSHLRSASFGAGGRQQMSARQFGYVGAKLKEEYGFLDGFAQALANGELTATQALNRAGMYGQGIRSSFFRAEHQTKDRDGFLGKRSLDAGASHCPECVTYSTQGKYVPASEIIPIATNCTCKRFCRCQITWQRGKVDLSQRLVA